MTDFLANIFFGGFVLIYKLELQSLLVNHIILTCYWNLEFATLLSDSMNMKRHHRMRDVKTDENWDIQVFITSFVIYVTFCFSSLPCLHFFLWNVPWFECYLNFCRRTCLEKKNILKNINEIQMKYTTTQLLVLRTQNEKSFYIVKNINIKFVTNSI